MKFRSKKVFYDFHTSAARAPKGIKKIDTEKLISGLLRLNGATRGKPVCGYSAGVSASANEVRGEGIANRSNAVWETHAVK